MARAGAIVDLSLKVFVSDARSNCYGHHSHISRDAIFTLSHTPLLLSPSNDLKVDLDALTQQNERHGFSRANLAAGCSPVPLAAFNPAASLATTTFSSYNSPLPFPDAAQFAPTLDSPNPHPRGAHDAAPDGLAPAERLVPVA